MTNKKYVVAIRTNGFCYTSLFVHDGSELLEKTFKAMAESHIECIAKKGKKPMVAMLDKRGIAIWPEGEFFNRDDLKIVEYNPLATHAKDYWD